MINVWTQNNLFHDPHDVILTSQKALREMGDDYDEWPLRNILKELKMLAVVKITTSNILSGFQDFSLISSTKRVLLRVYISLKGPFWMKNIRKIPKNDDIEDVSSTFSSSVTMTSKRQVIFLANLIMTVSDC